MMPFHANIFIVAMALFLLQAQAETLRVPEEYATIQTALDSANAWDTVLVAPGTYHEFLIGPAHSFVLSGWYPPDSVNVLQTLLDPIPSAGPDTPSVFAITHDTAFISNFAFFNSSELRQDESQSRTGAIQNNAGFLHVERCRFDSVSVAIRGGLNIWVDNCSFLGCVGPCVQPDIGGRVISQHSSFESGAYAIIFAYSNSRFEDCVFSCNTNGGHFLDIGGSNIQINRCRFGPCVGAFWVIDIYPVANIVIENCVFEGIDRVNSILAAGIDCSIVEGAPITIRGNTFRDNHQGVIAIDLQCAQPSSGFLGIIEVNTFTNCDAINELTPGIHTLNSSAEICDNIFEALEPEDLPDIFAQGTSQDTILARNNSFLPPGVAASRSGSYFDARENWWGDSTGPYNATQHPEGQGSTVGNGVLYDPWLTSAPDTTVDTNSVSNDDPVVLQPALFTFSAFPNPFNSTLSISLEVPLYQEVNVMLYDLLGREVDVVYQGRLSTNTISYSAPATLSSGIYFLRAATLDQVVLGKVVLLR